MPRNNGDATSLATGESVSKANSSTWPQNGIKNRYCAEGEQVFWKKWRLHEPTWLQRGPSKAEVHLKWGQRPSAHPTQPKMDQRFQLCLTQDSTNKAP